MKTFFLFVMLSLSAWAQSGQGRISGTVTDSSGALLPKALIAATDAKTGAKREVSVDEKGYYILLSLSPSTYTLTATTTNFAPSEVREYTLSAGQERTLNMSLGRARSPRKST